MADSRSLWVVIGAKTDQFKVAMTDLNKEVGKAEKNWKKTFGNIGLSMKNAGQVMAGAGAAIVAPMALAIKSFAETADSVEELSIRSGLGTTAIQELGYAAKLTGSSIDGVETAVKKMQVTIKQAGDGSSAAAKKITSMGLSIEDIKKMSPDEQFMTIAGAIADISDPTDRAATAIDIFGKAGTDMLPMLENGRAGLEKMRLEANSTGGVMDSLSVKSGAQLQDSMDKLQTSFTGMGNSLAVVLSPVLTELIEKITGIMTGFSEWSAQHPLLSKVVLLTVAAIGVLLVSMGGLLMLTGTLLTKTNLYLISLVAHKVATVASTVVTGLQTAAQWALNVAMDANPIGLLILAIGALIAIGFVLWKNWDSIVIFFKGAWETLKTVFSSGFEWIKTYVIDPFMVVWNGMVDGIRNAINTVRGLFGQSTSTPSTGGRGSTQVIGGGPDPSPDWSVPTPVTVPVDSGKYVPPVGVYQGPPRAGYEYATGGIAYNPQIASLAENGPEMVLPLSKLSSLEKATVNRLANIIVELDGRAILKAIGQPLADEIRIRNGLRT